MKTYDAVIVGARGAGAATAMLLARAGSRCSCSSAPGTGTDTLSTHALMRGGVVQLRRWGLLDRLVEAGTPPVRRTSFHYGDETVTVSVKPAAGVDALYAPRRTLLDRVLVDAAVEAGAEVRFGVDVTGVLRHPDGRVGGVVARDRRGEEVATRARITIGADGARSLVARAVGAPTVREGTGSGAVVYGYWPGLDVEGYEWFYRPGVTAGLIPTNDGEVCVFAGAPTPRFRREVAGDVAAWYLRTLKEVTGGDPRLDGGPRRLRTHVGRVGRVRRPWGAGWALVGDAGHVVDPLSTHGITDALRDAELLSEAVLSGDEAALGRYEERRDRAAGPMFAAIDGIASYGWTLPAVRRLLMELSSAMSDEVETLSGLVA